MKTKKMSNIWFAPIITLGIMLFFYAVAGVYPFGTNSSAFSDAVGQYVPMIGELAQKIKEGSSLFFSWHAGRGTNFWTVISYYLASPGNLIALLFDSDRMDDAFSIISLTKPVLMALTFGIYYKHTYKKDDLSLVIFSLLWAFSNFITSAYFFVSWMDSIIYFPLVVLGLKRLMDGKSGWLYALFLGLTITSNFYIGWMVCIFCVLYFIYSFISDDDVVYEGKTVSTEKEKKDIAQSEDNSQVADDSENVNIFAVFKNSYLLSSIFRFAFASLLGGAISAIFSLPTVYSLLNTAKGQTTNSKFVLENIWGILASHVFPLLNNYDTLRSTKYIFCFAGLLTLLLCVIYFFNKNISVRKKVGNAFLLVFFWASISIYTLYFIWHGMGEPMGLMFRFAFLYSFVLLKIAIEAFVEIKHTPIYSIFVGVGVIALCTSGIYFDPILRNYFFNVKTIASIILFTLAFAVLLICYIKKPKKQIISAILLVCVIIETVVMNYGNLNYRDINGMISEISTVSEVNQMSEDSEYIHFAKKDTSFNDVANYGFLFNYNATEVYSSLANGDFALTIQDFGVYGNAMNAEAGSQEQTPVFNLFFPVKYYIDGSKNLTENEYRKLIKSDGDYNIFENQFTMPFMYTVPYTIDGWDPFSYISPADNQRESFKFITATEENILYYNEMVNVKYENCEGKSNLDKRDEVFGTTGGYSDEFYNFLESRYLEMSCKITDKTKPAYITFDSVAQSDGLMYLYVDITQFTDLSITYNGVTRDYTAFGVGENRTYEVGEVKKGDVVTIKMGGYRNEPDADGNVYKVDYESYAALAYTIDMDIFKEGYNKLDSMSDTEMLEFSDTYVKAKVTSYEDGILYIPTAYDEGWTITIDGEEVPLYEHESHILMTEITKGEHIVEMKYCPQGFKAGVAITGASIAILIAWAVISKKRNDKFATNNVNEE